MTVIIALAAAFVPSLTFVPALIAILVTGTVQERENVVVRGLKRIYAPGLAGAIRRPRSVIALALVLFGAAALVFARTGQEFIPTRDPMEGLQLAVTLCDV